MTLFPVSAPTEPMVPDRERGLIPLRQALVTIMEHDQPLKRAGPCSVGTDSNVGGG